MTSLEDLLLEVGISLEESGLLANVQPVLVGEPGYMGMLVGTTRIEHQTLRVQIGIPDDFPCTLPLVRIVDASAVRWVPHITDDGVICYHEVEGVSSSLWRPADVIVEALSRALTTLRKGMLGENVVDYAAEAEWYWSRSGVSESLLSYINPSKLVKSISVVQNELGMPVAVDDSEKGVVPHLPTVPNGLFIPLEGSLTDTGFHPGQFLSASALRGVVRRHLTEENRKILASRCKKHRILEWAMVGLPRVDGDQALIAMSWKPRGTACWLLNGAQQTEVEIRPYLVTRMDRARLVERGGASSVLSRYKVAVVGCGAVGGYVADALSRTGIGHLLLVDPDCLGIENVFRHVLGRHFIGMPKVDGLAVLLMMGVPYLQVTKVRRSVQEVLEDSPQLLSDCDVIVNAMGSTTSTRWLNRRLHRRLRARMVHTWLEPLGIGGHAVLNAAGGGPGCCECLFIDDDGEERLHARCDFAASGQTLTTGRAGCGGTYTPYGDIDARRTAEVATRLVVQTLLGAQGGPHLHSWKGSERAFIEAGHRLSNRFELDAEKLADQGRALARGACPVCGGRQ